MFSVQPQRNRVSGYDFVFEQHGGEWQPRSRNPRDSDMNCLEATAWAQESLAFLGCIRSCTARYASALCCSNTKSLPDTLRIAGSSMASLWRREAASKKSVRDITRIFGFMTTIKLPHALQIHSTVFALKCMRWHFQGSAATNYSRSGKFNCLCVGR